MTNHRKNLRRHRGIWLVELVAVLVVLGAVLLITADIAASSSRAAADARKMDTIVTKLDQFISLLRKDVWATSAMHATTDPGGTTLLELEDADGRSTRWQFTPPVIPDQNAAPEQLSVTRTSPGGVIREYKGLPNISLRVTGPLVTLEVVPISRHPVPGTGSRELATERMTLVSQRLLATTDGSEGGAR